jgi:hypothetical protein
MGRGADDLPRLPTLNSLDSALYVRRVCRAGTRRTTCEEQCTAPYIDVMGVKSTTCIHMDDYHGCKKCNVCPPGRRRTSCEEQCTAPYINVMGMKFPTLRAIIMTCRHGDIQSVPVVVNYSALVLGIYFQDKPVVPLAHQTNMCILSTSC